jgi:hypothetical protein
VTVASLRASRARMARRVGSARARRVESSGGIAAPLISRYIYK